MPLPGRNVKQHRYDSCRDDDCERLACRAWKEGYAEGYIEGVQSCPLGHI